jgi:hypothetical protein
VIFRNGTGSKLKDEFMHLEIPGIRSRLFDDGKPTASDSRSISPKHLTTAPHKMKGDRRHAVWDQEQNLVRPRFSTATEQERMP